MYEVVKKGIYEDGDKSNHIKVGEVIELIEGESGCTEYCIENGSEQPCPWLDSCIECMVENGYVREVEK